MFVRAYFARMKSRPMVRPWGLAAPILVLLISLPLLRPLRHPMSADMSGGEQSRIATIQAIVEHHTLAIDQTSYADAPDSIMVNGRHYSDQPPMLAALLATPYWVMYRLGWTLQTNPTLVIYLLTLLGAALPAALSAGLIYRMGRLFELRRPWRTALAASVVLGSGLISYAVVLNAHVPAAFLVLCAAACLIYVSMSPQPRRSSGWIPVAGVAAALAAAIDPSAAVFLVLLVPVILCFRWNIWGRAAGVGLFAAGALPILALNTLMIRPITGDFLPPALHPELMAMAAPSSHAAEMIDPNPTNPFPDDEMALLQTGAWRGRIKQGAERISSALFGDHGAVSHFPILLIALLGTAAVMHRHWPTSTKALAVATLLGSAVIVAACALGWADWAGAMFAARWFIVFLPLLIFWCGAWLRRPHRPVTWTVAGVLLAFSVGVSLLGATDPCPRGGFHTYTAAGALDRLIHAQSPPLPDTTLAGR